MLLQIGARTTAVEVVDLLIECHGRIRRFLELAARLALTRGVEPAEVQATAGQIRRYFAGAFPLHLADEEEVIRPRLAGQAAALDEALATMHADHEEHAGLVARLLDLSTQLSRDPARIGHGAAQLADVTESLRAVLEPHLVLEERVIFPAIARLPAAEREAIRTAMRLRREPR